MCGRAASHCQALGCAAMVAIACARASPSCRMESPVCSSLGNAPGGAYISTASRTIANAVQALQLTWRVASYAAALISFDTTQLLTRGHNSHGGVLFPAIRNLSSCSALSGAGGSD